MSHTPLFSCVIPVKGDRPFLGEAIDSLKVQGLGDNLQIIVQDADVEPDAGQSDALNKGFAKAKGEWLFWLNADDVLLPGALKKVRDFVDCVDGGIGSRKERKERKDDSRVEGGEGKILLVTSAWHMKRARLMFKKYAPGIEVVCAPADFENTFMAEKTSLLKMLLPDPNVFMLNSVAFHEWVGIVGYKAFR